MGTELLVSRFLLSDLFMEPLQEIHKNHSYHLSYLERHCIRRFSIVEFLFFSKQRGFLEYSSNQGYECG